MKNFILTFFLFTGFSSPLISQSLLKGKIVDGRKEPLIGATVVIQSTNQFAITGEEGVFTLENAKAFPIILQINFVGFKESILELREHTTEKLIIQLEDDLELSEVLITARRRSEEVQKVPIPISVVGGPRIEESGSFNVNRVKELVPTVQLYSSNPRNTTLNIRGLGSTFGLTNDGIDPGVGFYVDGVYYARPAATSLDFIDIEQIEVLRGPQGTLFGKNTTAGAFNITTRLPSYTPGGTVELSYGNYGFIQAKTSITGPLTKNLAARVSFSGTQRDGVIENIATGKMINDLNNLGFRGQLLYNPSSKVEIILAGDATSQRPDGYAQVVAGVVETQRAPYRRFEQIISDLNYQLPSRNAFDRKVDHDTPWRSNNDLGGLSLNADVQIGEGTLTSTTAWRYWNWGPSNDRDFTGLPVLSLSQAPSRHEQFSQEIRYAGDFSNKLSGVFGVFFLSQNLKTSPYHTEESGAAQWRFSQSSTSTLWATPGLLDGYGIRTYSTLESVGAALFGQLDWAITEKLHFLPGIRFNYDQKSVDFNRETYGGLQTTDPALLAIKRSVYAPQQFVADVEDQNWSGQATLTYQFNDKINTFGTFSTSYKPVGINLGGLPTANGQPLLELAEVKPEFVRHFELGVKTTPVKGSSLNVTFFNTNIQDYQTLVQTAEVGVNRGYLANAEEVRVSGLELDGNVRLSPFISLNAALAYTDAIYVSFPNAPVPLEETGGESAFKDISGGRLPGISKWAGSLGGEFAKPAKFFKKTGTFFLGTDLFFRSEFSSSPSPSRFLNVEGYALVNARTGFRVTEGFSAFVWARNLLNQNYYEQLLPAAGNAGHYAAVLGDPLTYGMTFRYAF
ncbi:iron complex outermembrane receptor protein [Algoriphagus aquaeductus]|uniref:Iron complex outermembrane receptor protein n=1 Tax=Algoriphagus aquaeductus TaxID=475299 RepID=A0A326RJY3_9BACT|nr:TonB-dependent receptor [Algoriphagus aquaeductus]PZV75760.1 iron complex outermembrane receptor protein [Algoriphagus aquaeductus]